MLCHISFSTRACPFELHQNKGSIPSMEPILHLKNVGWKTILSFWEGHVFGGELFVLGILDGEQTNPVKKPKSLKLEEISAEVAGLKNRPLEKKTTLNWCKSHHRISEPTISSWRVSTFNPSEKYYCSQIENLPQNRDENQKYLKPPPRYQI